MSATAHIAPMDATAGAQIARGLDRPVVILNLLNFHDFADYPATPDLPPDTPITGAAAYDLCMEGIAADGQRRCGVGRYHMVRTRTHRRGDGRRHTVHASTNPTGRTGPRNPGTP